MADPNIFITCHPRISEILKDELTSLGYDGLVDRKGVRLQGSFMDAMKLNLFLRTANRILFKLTSFKAAGAEELYKKTCDFEWESILPADGYFSVQSSVRNESIKDNRFANKRLKDAIVDRIASKRGRRPNTGPDYNKAVLFLFWNNYDVDIYYDTSGETISRRVYRKNPWKAPMNEALAAATVLATRWDGKTPFVNPMCGSGTLAIEAAFISMERAPGVDRENFSFMHCNMYDARVWRMLRNEALSKARSRPRAEIICTDRDPGALSAVRENAKRAGIANRLDIAKCDFAETRVPPGPGVVFLNPEYGERLGDENELEQTYSAIGDFFKTKCSGYHGYVFTGNLDLAKKVGLATSRKIPLFNGKIDSRLLEYELYEGSRRQQKEE